MNKKLSSKLILRLSDLLVGKQVATNKVSASLEEICTCYAFESGLIYEIDQHNCFHLKEYYSADISTICDRFVAADIDHTYRRYMAEEEICYIEKKNGNTSGELQLLSLFFATTLVLITVVDENYRIYGFVVFLNTKIKNAIVKKYFKQLTSAIHMLGRYVGKRMAQNRLSFAQTSLEDILDNTGIDIYVNDFYSHDILYVNKSMAAPYGGMSRFLGNKCWEVLFPDQGGPCEFCPQKQLLDEQGNPSKVYSWDYQRPFDGSWFRVFSAAFRWVDGRLAHVVSSANITDNKRNEALIHYMANYDSLTNLPNRRMLISECERRINQASEDQTGHVLFFDIDGFKAINDDLGHDAGDEFLVQLGAFFSGIPLLQNAIYRNGGDEFVAILDSGMTEAAIRNLICFIHERFKKPWVLKNGEVVCNTSVGVACYPEDGTKAEVLLNKADQAMYHAKKAGGGAVCFVREMK